MAIKFADPAVVDLVNWDRIQVMQFFAAAPDDGYEIRLLQKQQMFRNGLSRHGKVAAKLAERLTVLSEQNIEKAPAAFVGEGLKHSFHGVIIGNHMVACQASSTYKRRWFNLENEGWKSSSAPKAHFLQALPSELKL